jgi:hypothetical protein
MYIASTNILKDIATIEQNSEFPLWASEYLDFNGVSYLKVKDSVLDVLGNPATVDLKWDEEDTGVTWVNLPYTNVHISSVKADVLLGVQRGIDTTLTHSEAPEGITVHFSGSHGLGQWSVDTCYNKILEHILNGGTLDHNPQY